jgi:hypothetical protein
MADDYFFKPLKTYIVSEGVNYTRKQAEELAQNNKRKAPVFFILVDGPHGPEGILFFPDGTSRETTLSDVKARLREIAFFKGIPHCKVLRDKRNHASSKS